MALLTGVVAFLHQVDADWEPTNAVRAKSGLQDMGKAIGQASTASAARWLSPRTCTRLPAL